MKLERGEREQREFPFPSKEKSLQSPLSNKSQIRSPCRTEVVGEEAKARGLGGEKKQKLRETQ